MKTSENISQNYFRMLLLVCVVIMLFVVPFTKCFGEYKFYQHFTFEPKIRLLISEQCWIATGVMEIEHMYNFVN